MKIAKTLSLYLGVILICGCQDRQQQQPVESTSTKQNLPIPDFVGFSLGKVAPSISMCKARDAYGNFSGGQEICWWGVDKIANNVSLDLVPDGLYMLEFPQHKIPNGIRAHGDIIVIDNVVHSISLTSDGFPSENNLLDLLKDKYGEPDKLEWKSAISENGRQVPYRDATWIYRDGYIRFQGITSSMDKGSVSASTYEADEWVKRGFGKNADSF